MNIPCHRSRQDSDMVKLLQNARKNTIAIKETDSEAMDKGQEAPFVLLCSEGNLQAVRCAVFAGDVDINQGDKFRQTGLMWAAFNNHNDVVDFLLLQPAIDPTLRANTGETVLHGAGEANNVHALQKLIAHPKMGDLDFATKNRDGKTAEDLAR